MCNRSTQTAHLLWNQVPEPGALQMRSRKIISRLPRQMIMREFFKKKDCNLLEMNRKFMAAILAEDWVRAAATSLDSGFLIPNQLHTATLVSGGPEVPATIAPGPKTEDSPFTNQIDTNHWVITDEFQRYRVHRMTVNAVSWQCIAPAKANSEAEYP
ncbi:hypothetical protein AVEN_172848-1 [Araneus ventricosus]|uniref:Uncharacterized protein n=1 Tax=Araneus ventricosus TaxID=182803 RepID=A0A4Y2PDA2_ARAVE|nr:hypothetical protein AVEN_172848-1 [Araneus ventricosus]